MRSRRSKTRIVMTKKKKIYYDEFSDVDGDLEDNEEDAEAGVVLKMACSEKSGKDRGRLMELCAKVQASGERTVTAGDIADLSDFPFDKFQRMSIQGLIERIIVGGVCSN